MSIRFYTSGVYKSSKDKDALESDVEQLFLSSLDDEDAPDVVERAYTKDCIGVVADGACKEFIDMYFTNLRSTSGHTAVWRDEDAVFIASNLHLFYAMEQEEKERKETK